MNEVRASLAHHAPRCVLLAAALLPAAISCGTGKPAGGEVPADPLPVKYAADTDFDVPGDAGGAYDTSGLAVWGFSHNSPVQQDPQVDVDLVPDIVLRGWMAGFHENQTAGEYTVGFLERCHAKGIVFMGGLTGSAAFREDTSSQQEFNDRVTRDARGQLVEHTETGFPMYRGSIANPKYRRFLLDRMKMQIDLGADGIDVDESDGEYNGGERWVWNGNEGYDDYFIADFNLYLIKRYPQYTEQDWVERFGMRPGNLIRPELPYTDLRTNFNYRRYLQENGWDSDPRNPANPLAAEFGPSINERLDLGDASFTEKATRLYWKEMVLAIRAYAREVYQREILVTANGIFPYVDFNELGMYDWNRDDGGAEAKYVPTTATGHLDGARSLKPVFQQLHARSSAASGDVPLVVFVDWPGGTIDRYYALPTSEKMDFWRIYVPEAQAAGLYYALYLKTSDPSDPTATELGVIDFLSEYAGFYRQHRDLYRGAVPTDRVAQVSKPNVVASISEQPTAQRWLVHLVNHDYDAGIRPQAGLSVSFDSPAAPASVSLVTPDASGSEVPFSYAGARTTVTVDALRFYDVLVVQW